MHLNLLPDFDEVFGLDALLRHLGNVNEGINVVVERHEAAKIHDAGDLREEK